MEQLCEALLRQALVINKLTAKVLVIIIPQSLRELTRCLVHQAEFGVIKWSTVSRTRQTIQIKSETAPARGAEAVISKCVEGRPEHKHCCPLPG